MNDNVEFVEIPIVSGYKTITKGEVPGFILSKAVYLKGITHDSLIFYSGIDKVFPRNSHPAELSYAKVLVDISSITKNLTLQTLIRQVPIKAAHLQRINVQLMDWLVQFFGFKKLPQEDAYIKIGRKRFRIKKGEPLSWQEDPEFQQKLNELKILFEDIQAIEISLADELFKEYNYSRISDMGSQRAKNLIDKSYAASTKQAIKYLKKAISYENQTFMAYKACNSLADIYLGEGQYDLAVENYTQAIQAIEAVTLNPNQWAKKLYLLRGLAYTKLGQMKHGIHDIQNGLEGLEEPEKYFEIYASEYEEALAILQENH